MNEKTPNKQDKCVVCRKTTKYAEKDNIYIREGYVEGVGQLCESCFSDVSKENWLLQDWVSSRMNESEQENAK